MKIEWQSLFTVAFAALCVALVRPACGQVSEFSFDLAGNLLTQRLETSALPQIIGQPQMQVVIPGESASFSVVVADTSGLSYQWYFNSSPIAGATSDALLITNVNTANQGPYWVAVSNALGSVASTLAFLYLDSNGSGMPDWWQLQYFGTLNQSALGDFDGDGVSNLQEFLDGTNPTNAASALYRITLFNYGGGTVVAVPDQPAYTNGQVVTLTATGSAAAPFHAWTGDMVTRSNSITVTMSTNKTLFAFFSPFELVWTNTVGGDWYGAPNWTPNLAPGSNEIVVIGTQGVTVTLNSNVDLLSLTLGSPLYVVGPDLTGSGRLTISGTGTWVAGSMSGSGATVVLPGASFAMLTAVSELALVDRTFENGGTVYWNGGALSVQAGVITNDAGALFAEQSPGTVSFGGGAPRFDNAGTFVTASNGTTAFAGVSFNNYGWVNIQGGTFTMSGGGDQAGTTTVPAGATINFAGGIFTTSGNPSLTGQGTLMVSAGTETLGGTVNVTGSNVFSAGAIDFTGNYTCTNNAMVISGGTASFDGTGTVAPSTLTLSTGTGVLGGSDVVTVGNSMSWTGGSMTGTGRTVIPPGVTLTINNSSAGISITSRTLDNGGTILWPGGLNGLTMNGGVITNEPGALFQVQSPESISGSSAPRFDNAGIFRAAGAGTTIFSGVNFNNYNDTQIQAGTLQLDGGLNDGTMEVPAGTTLDLGGGIFTSSAGSSITGAGNFTVSAAYLVSGVAATLSGLVKLAGTNTFSNGTAELNGNYTCTNNTMLISGGTANFDGTGTVSPSVINLSSGTLGGSNLVTVGSTMSWTGGGMSGTGRTFIPAAASLNINNPSGISITSRTLDNAGVTTWTGAGGLGMNGGIITNRPGALFNPQSSSFIEFEGGSPRFDNAGTFRKSVSPGTTTISGEVPFTNYGTVDIQSGILTMNGGYASTSNALLNCAIGGKTPGTNFGQLQVSGTVALNGNLSVNFTNGYFPATNDSFTLVTAGARSNTFANFTYPSNLVTMQLSNTASSVIAQVTGAVSAPPPPVLMPPVISGSNILFTWTANSNFIYRLEYNPALPASNWNVVPGDVTTSSNTASKLDSLTPSNRFYRLQVLP